LCAALPIAGADSSPAITLVASAPGTEPRLSVDYPDEDVRVILRQVADQLELNLVLPDTLRGRTTLRLRRVTWRQVFDAVLSPVNHAFVEEGNIVKVLDHVSTAEEPLTTEVIVIQHARASDIAPVIRALVDEAAGGKVLVDARTNALIITERPSRLGQARPLARQLDQAR
jgi:type IV pilus assembly protein PilQ